MIWSALPKFARLLVDYCAGVKKGDEVIIRAGIGAYPLIRELWGLIVERSAQPYFLVDDEVLAETYYRRAPPELLDMVPDIVEAMTELADVRISIISPSHTKPLTSIDPAKIARRRAALREVSQTFLKRAAEGSLRWVVTAYPTHALAQEAGMSPLEYEEFVIKAVKAHLDDPVRAWEEQAAWQERIRGFLNKVSELRFVAEDTDITVRVEGRNWVNDDGKNNMPGGEVFTGPHEDGVNGYITFTYPAVWGGREVEGVKLVFKEGKVVEAHAVRGEDFLLKMLDTDEGAKRLGEVAFGLNYDISRYTKEILFDEKIGGTIHMALGASYPETGGKNVSAIHWDMVKDMRNGKVYADGDLIYENGKLIEGIF